MKPAMGRRRVKPATIYDVARAAGVSHMTVSRVLADFAGIRPATRARVMDAVEALQYRPNASARSLRTSRSNRIGIIADRVDQHGPALVLVGARTAAREHGYVIDVVSVDGLSPEEIRSAVHELALTQAAGILSIAHTDVSSMLPEVGPDDTVLLDSTLLVTSDTSSNAVAGALAADHLLDLGHRDIGYVSGPTAWISARSRRDSFVARVAARGGRLAWVVEGDWTARSGHAAWRARGAGAVSAVAAANDSMAIGVISAATADGLAVPGALSVVGVDDLPESAFLNPPLSTIALDFEGEGRTFLESFLSRLSVPVAVRSTIHPPHLVPRSTTAPR